MDISSIDYSEGKVFSFDDESGIRPDNLQSIDYSSPRQRISYQMDEFAAVCSFWGLPDSGIDWVDHIHQNKLVGMKSLKYYFISFRNFGIFQEDVTSRIFNYLYPLLEPEKLLIKTRYSTRGRIDNTCIINSNEQKS